MQNIRWAVLGTGVIANEMAVALKKNGRNIDAVGNRTHEKAVAFAEKYGIKKEMEICLMLLLEQKRLESGNVMTEIKLV